MVAEVALGVQSAVKVADIRDAYTLLGFDDPIKDAKRVKTKYRSLVLERSSNLTHDAEETARRNEDVRLLHEAIKVAMDFCASTQTLEEVAQEGEIDVEQAHEEYRKRVHLFLGRILQMRYQFWTRVALGYPESTPEFDPSHPKTRLSHSQQGIFTVIYEENGRKTVRYTLDFVVHDSMAWVVMEMVDGTYEALVFFTLPPTQSHVLPERNHTTVTREAVVAILEGTDLRKVRSTQEAEFWGLHPKDTWLIRVGATTSLCWITKIQGVKDDISFYWAYSVEEFKIALPTWVARVKAESWASPL